MELKREKRGSSGDQCSCFGFSLVGIGIGVGVNFVAFCGYFFLSLVYVL